MGNKTKKKLNTSTMWLAKGMAKMMISNKDTEILANNLKKLPPQRTPPELDRLQHSAKGLPIFKALRTATKKSRELCRVLKLKEIGKHEQWLIHDEHMLVVVLSGEILARTVNKVPFDNTLNGELEHLEEVIGMDIPVDDMLALPAAALPNEESQAADQAHVTDNLAQPDDGASSSEVAGMSLADWQRVFEHTDEDGSGSLSSEEIFTMLKGCKIDVGFEDVEHLVKELDDDGSLELEFEEFAVLITKLTQGSGSSSWKMNPGVGWQNVFKTGSFFGEVSLLGGSGMSASLEALGGSGAKFMVLDKNSFQAIMIEGFDAYMAQRVEFLKGHCQLLHGLNRLSDLKSIAFLADEEMVADGETILKQGAAADTAVVITSGACKLMLKVEQHELEDAARRAGWQPEGWGSRDYTTPSRLRSTQRPGKVFRTIELAEIHYGELIGESAILQEREYYASLVATHNTAVVRLPVEPLLQLLNKVDVARVQDFCRMRKQFRSQQLQSKALSLLTSSSSAAGFALNAQRKETARSTTNELRWIPSSQVEQTHEPQSQMSPEPHDSLPAVSSYKTPQQIRQEAQRDVMEAYRSANLQEQFKEILARATGGMDTSDFEGLGVPRSKSTEPLTGRASSVNMATWPTHNKPSDLELAPRSKSICTYPLRTLAVDEDAVGNMIDTQCQAIARHVQITLPKPRNVAKPALQAPSDFDGPEQLPLFPPGYPTLADIVSQTAGSQNLQTLAPKHSLSEATPSGKSNCQPGQPLRTHGATDPRIMRSQREVLPPAVALRTGTKDQRSHQQYHGTDRGLHAPCQSTPAIQRQAGGQRAGHLLNAGRLVDPQAVGPRKVQHSHHEVRTFD